MASIMVEIRRWVCGFGSFDGGDELSGVEDGLVDAAVAAFAQETVGGEAISGGNKLGIAKMADFKRLIPFAIEIAAASGYGRVCRTDRKEIH